MATGDEPGKETYMQKELQYFFVEQKDKPSVLFGDAHVREKGQSQESLQLKTFG